MRNYEHEISVVEDIAMRKFLWYDYFHDSTIANISFCPRSGKQRWPQEPVTLTIYCAGDCERAYDALPEKAQPEDGWAFLTSGRFTYLVSFCGVVYFESKGDPDTMEYLNGRFKDTQLVRQLNTGSKRPYYHFRIQTTGGYLDIVFNKLKIRKAVGRVNYSLQEYPSYATLPQDAFDAQYLPHPHKADDWTCFKAMQKLYREGSTALAEYARQCLQSELPVEDAKPYAAYILGKVGKKSDLDMVKAMYFRTKDELQKRHILDAIETLDAL